MRKAKKIEVLVLGGVEGACLAVNGRRVAGPKPWGGGIIRHEWHVPLSELRTAINDSAGDRLLRALEKIEALIAEFGADSAACLAIVSEYVGESLHHHAPAPPAKGKR